MAQEERKCLRYIVTSVFAFAERKQITPSEAFLYLYQNNGISFLVDFYDVEHTLSIEEMLDDLERVCKEGVSA